MSTFYKIPEELIQSFTKEALKTIAHNGSHNETLAIVTGYWSGNLLIAHDLIFPKQIGCSTSVEDLGKYIYNLLKIVYNFLNV